ncbi:MAG: reverse transcriptase domain-containing protein, partial [Oscillospiraceae bacterium]
VQVAYIDFQKAFDSVSHPKLLHKLSGYGIHGNLLFWISSFLTNLIQQVRIGSSLSLSSQVIRGVPQGSVLGPLLFNLFINDVTDSLDSSSTTKIFADDIKIYSEITNPNSITNFQSQLNLIHVWSVTWQLPISHHKCCLLMLGHQTTIDVSLTINNIPLEVPNFAIDLGVIVDPHLKFDKHIHDIVARAKQRGAIIHRCFLSHNVNNLIMAFKTYVRPILEYAPLIWSPYLHYLIDLVESVQRSFTKRLPGFAQLTYTERLVNLNLQSLEHRRLLFDLTMCYNIIHGCSALSFGDFFAFSNKSTTRGHSLKLSAHLCKSNIRKHFFAVRVVPIWNSLPEKIVTSGTTRTFKKLISTYDFSMFLTFPCYVSPSPLIV